MERRSAWPLTAFLGNESSKAHVPAPEAASLRPLVGDAVSDRFARRPISLSRYGRTAAESPYVSDFRDVIDPVACFQYLRRWLNSRLSRPSTCPSPSKSKYHK